MALLERQRNPGVGYWSSLGGERPQSPSDSRRSGSIESSNGAAAAFLQSSSEEEINYEYLRNVILQFLEHKDRRVSVFIHDVPLPDSTCNLAQPSPGVDNNSQVHPPRNATSHCESVIPLGCEQLTRLSRIHQLLCIYISRYSNCYIDQSPFPPMIDAFGNDKK